VSPWVDAPLAPVTWRFLGFLLDLLLIVCTVFVGWLSWWIIVWDTGRTPAKSILHTRIVRSDNRQLPSFARMALREAIGKGVAGLAGAYGLYKLGDGGTVPRLLLAAALAWLAMSVVSALLDDNRRALWDVFSGTVVVLDPEVSPTEDGCTEPT
jgi:uncharacterized RDD family membrane protein YckC